MSEYLAEDIRGDLENAYPDLFERLWDSNSDWVEPPNHRRGGWSGAKRITLTFHGVPRLFFLKIQENHFYRSRHPPFRLRPTFEREARALIALQKMQVRVPTLCYYGVRRIEGKERSLVLIPDLYDYCPADELLQQLTTAPCARTRHTIATAIGREVGQMHRAGWIHRHLVTKHFLVRKHENDTPDVCIVDLEKARPMIVRGMDVINDLARLNRKTGLARLSDQVAFMKGYWQTNRLSPKEQRFMARIAARSK